jgi:exosortase
MPEAGPERSRRPAAVGTAPVPTGCAARPGRSVVLSRSLLAVLLAAGLIWAYWPTFLALEQRWSDDPQASHGFLVPFFALFLLWHRRARLPDFTGPLNWWGVVLLELAGAARLAGGRFAFEWLDAISLLPALAGCLVLLGGTRALGWSWPALLFLQFMIPWPFQVEAALAAPLQRLATECGTYVLQTVGYPALAEGNIILIGDLKIGVLEACNGLGMLFAFFALSTAIALTIDRRLPDRLVIFASAVPVGVLVNLIRITATAVAVVELHDEQAFRRFHDVVGWLMMPVALLFLWLELKLLDWLFVAEPDTGPVALFLPAEVPVAQAAPGADAPGTPALGSPPPGTPAPDTPVRPLTETRKGPTPLDAPDPGRVGVAPAAVLEI